MRVPFFERGWCRFPYDPGLMQWVAAAVPAARAAVLDPENAAWLRCGGTWFAGVNALPNDAAGALDGGPPLSGSAVHFAGELFGGAPIAWDRGQISVCYPGYPQPMESESDSAFRYRRDRDAAHVDGIHAIGPQRHRYLRECHAFVLGIPLVDASPDASPLVVWEASHEVMRTHFRTRLASTPADGWNAVDITGAYHAARRAAFATCKRIEIAARPGEAYLIHRLALHGVAPWATSASAGPDGRMIAYFRPEFRDGQDWLAAP